MRYVFLILLFFLLILLLAGFVCAWNAYAAGNSSRSDFEKNIISHFIDCPARHGRARHIKFIPVFFSFFHRASFKNIIITHIYTSESCFCGGYCIAAARARAHSAKELIYPCDGLLLGEKLRVKLERVAQTRRVTWLLRKTIEKSIDSVLNLIFRMTLVLGEKSSVNNI